MRAFVKARSGRRLSRIYDMPYVSFNHIVREEWKVGHRNESGNERRRRRERMRKGTGTLLEPQTGELARRYMGVNLRRKI